MAVVFRLAAALVLAGAVSTFAQGPTPLSQLLSEAEANNPQISAADHEARAARQMAPQISTLPDPKFTYQQFSVGMQYEHSDLTIAG